MDYKLKYMKLSANQINVVQFRVKRNLMTMHSFLCKGNNEIESFPKLPKACWEKKYVPKPHEDSGNRVL